MPSAAAAAGADNKIRDTRGHRAQGCYARGAAQLGCTVGRVTMGWGFDLPSLNLTHISRFCRSHSAGGLSTPLTRGRSPPRRLQWPNA